MSVAQKAPLELVVCDGPAGGFTESAVAAEALAAAFEGIAGLDKTKLLLFGGWQSASRGAGTTMQLVGERLGVTEQFQGVDKLTVGADGALEIKERVEGGAYQVSVCQGAPAVLGWATGELPEPPNNPQVGMQNMRLVMPALQKAKPAKVGFEGVTYAAVELPRQRRETRIVKDAPAEDIAREIVAWIRG